MNFLKRWWSAKYKTPNYEFVTLDRELTERELWETFIVETVEKRFNLHAKSDGVQGQPVLAPSYTKLGDEAGHQVVDSELIRTLGLGQHLGTPLTLPTHTFPTYELNE